MSQELTAQDWQAIALFYQKKYNELEVQVLALELEQQKAATAVAEAAEPTE